jgi:hypothetical protein
MNTFLDGGNTFIGNVGTYQTAPRRISGDSNFQSYRELNIKLHTSKHVLVSVQQGKKFSWVFVTGNQSQILWSVLLCRWGGGSDILISF